MKLETYSILERQETTQYNQELEDFKMKVRKVLLNQYPELDLTQKDYDRREIVDAIWDELVAD